MFKKDVKPTKTLMYFSGSVAIEDWLPEVHDNPNLGCLFTFFDIPKKRLKNIKNKMREDANNNKENK